MLTLGPLAFVDPWLLAGLAALPAIWWLLKVTPPAPRRVDFAAVRLLLGLATPERTPAHMPWWLLLLRLAAAALVILALAHPLLNPGAGLRGDGPLLLVVDDDWAAAPQWEHRSRALLDLIAEAEHAGKPVAIVTTAPTASGASAPVSLLTAGDAREAAQAIVPKPWPSDRVAAAAALGALAWEQAAEVVWLSNGLGGAEDVLLAALRRLGPVRVLADPDHELAMTLAAPRSDGRELRIEAGRVAGPARGVWVRASGERGQLLARRQLDFAVGAARATGAFAIPVEARNRIVRIDIEGQRSAAATVLLDERWRRRPVGLVSGEAPENAQPLLSGLYYLSRALEPFAEVREGRFDELLEQELAVLIVTDVGLVVGPDRARLERWIEGGGVLVRFSGPRLARNVDDLVPVRLRAGGRNIGGALSWAAPARLAPFAEATPFAGLVIPDDVLVHRQVLAEPSLDLLDKTWVRLTDGTPLVTAERRGQGRLVLFHVTATPDWSNLPLSGLFVEMLRRVVAASRGVAGDAGTALLAPQATLDGSGVLGAPAPGAQAIAAGDIAATTVGATHPPGFYGSAEARRALNLGADVGDLAALGPLPAGVSRAGYEGGHEIDFKPWLLAGALLLLLADLLASLWIRGLAPRLAPARLVLAAALAMAPATGWAQSPDDQFVLEATLATHLAFVRTGIPELDRATRAGLVGLTAVLARRTAVEAARPIAVDVERDPLSLFPLLYWAVDERQPDLSSNAQAKIDAYLRTGGTILFDTRDQGTVTPSLTFGGSSAGGPGTRRLRRILAFLDLPPLTIVPENHVLTRAFYLLREFPGRWAGGRVWVERHAGGVNDCVSPIIVGSNDWAAAWAIDDQGRPVAAVVPGGERQREMAYRFGVNLVMYALTGNYKADQVHVPAILERLGQ